VIRPAKGKRKGVGLPGSKEVKMFDILMLLAILSDLFLAVAAVTILYWITSAVYGEDGGS